MTTGKGVNATAARPRPATRGPMAGEASTPLASDPASARPGTPHPNPTTTKETP